MGTCQKASQLKYTALSGLAHHLAHYSSLNFGLGQFQGSSSQTLVKYCHQFRKCAYVWPMDSQIAPRPGTWPNICAGPRSGPGPGTNLGQGSGPRPSFGTHGPMHLGISEVAPRYCSQIRLRLKGFLLGNKPGEPDKFFPRRGISGKVFLNLVSGCSRLRI